MAQPSIIGTVDGVNFSKAYQPAANSGNSRLFEDVVIPSNANTVLVMYAQDTAESSRNITSFTCTNNSTFEATKTFLVDVSAGEHIRPTSVGVYDTSSLGALTGLDFTGVFDGSSSSGDGLFSIVCSTGFVQSFLSSNDRSGTKILNRMHSGNNTNSILLYMSSLDSNVSSFSFTSGTEVFKTAATGGGIALVSGVDTSTSSVKTIAADSSGGELGEFNILLSSQPNAFADIDPRGDIISHDIITN